MVLQQILGPPVDQMYFKGKHWHFVPKNYETFCMKIFAAKHTIFNLISAHFPISAQYDNV